MLQRTFLIGLFMFVQFTCSSLYNAVLADSQFETMVSEFRTPAENNHLWCYWYWINDDISKDGITKDLAAMKKAGIGTAFIGNINPLEKDGKVPLFSDLWWECMVHAVNEAKRLGVNIGVFNCPGWSQSGGPWVKPEMAMRYIVYSETVIDGPRDISQQLVKPKEEFQDLYVLAYPAFDNIKTLDTSNTTIRVEPEVKDPKNWIDGDHTTSAVFNSASSRYSIEFTAIEPVTARSIVIYPINKTMKIQCRLYARIDDKNKLISSFQIDRSNLNVNVGPVTNGPVAVSIPETRAQSFSLVCSDIQGKGSGFNQIDISEKPVLDSYIEKQLGKMHPTPLPMWGSYLWEQQPPIPGKLAVPTENVIDISSKMTKEGVLNWQVPEGSWTVMRVGMTPTGTQNAPAAPQGKGYEIDKANEDLIRFHFDLYVGKLLERIPAKNRDALKYVIMDSYEMGSQNWTDGFEQRFEKRYGYNPKKWLPVLSGVIVSSVTESERFLWDLRRAVADDVAYEYVGGLRNICNRNGLQTWLENYGHWGFPSEFLMYGGQSNLVGGEFWNEGTLGNIECKAASSCVHTYGKKICFAEAFTSANQTYKRHPAMLKKRGDWCFTEGVNQYVLHLYIHQPDDRRIPGMNAWFATEFNRHNTWFSQSRHWMNYARRCQHLLQQGAYVADVCYFISENAPRMTGVRAPELPDGYSYDYINAEIIVNDMQVKDGRLVLSSGASYSLLVLPPLDTMRPAVINKIEKLVGQGAAVYGPKPVRSPSMQDYPDCDHLVKFTADRIWGKDYLKGRLSVKYGLGRVFNDINLGDVLSQLRIAKDFDLENKSVLWTHRKMQGADIYFISNQSDDKINIKPVFRVEGLTPQVWDAVTGDIRLLHEYENVNNGTAVPLTLEPAQSQFVVFTNRFTDSVHPGYSGNYPVRRKLMVLDGSWTIAFDNPVIDIHEKYTVDDLQDWSLSENDVIKYYSGTAEYVTEFTLADLPADKEIFINLGKVGVMAEVTINGKFAGAAWIYPYLVNVTDLLNTGKNTLKVEVVNLWRNYLVKDSKLSEDRRKTWLSVSDVRANESLQPSGLIGPVRLETIDIKY